MTADVALSVSGTRAIVGTVDVPFTVEPGQVDSDCVPVALHLDAAALTANIADLLRAVADEFDRLSNRG